MKKAMLINPSGYVKAVDFPESEKLQRFHEMLDCEYVQLATPYGLEALAKEHGLGSYVGQYCLICDEEALLKEEPYANPVASIIYGVLDHGQPMFGKVLLVKSTRDEDGCQDIGGLDEQDMRKIKAGIDALLESYNRRARGGGD